MPVPIRDSVVVITGASSGIGRATALAFSKAGARVVVAARDDAALHEAAEECDRLGGTTLRVPVDVTDEIQVERLAEKTVETFGRIDTWVNNAGVLAYGRVEDTPTSTFRQVIDTNLFGPIHGTRAVLPIFRQQGAGVLINVASELGKFGMPYSSAYAASKFGLVGFSECVREELMDQPEIHVCTVLPSATDTPIFQHAANYTGRGIKAPPPVYAPEDVARVILSCAEQPQREVVVGNAGKRKILMHTVAPGLAERQIASSAEEAIFEDHSAPWSEGNLFHPMEHLAQVRGGWQEKERSGPSRMAMLGLAALGAGVGLWWITSGNGNHGSRSG